jgi:hypothetical protein
MLVADYIAIGSLTVLIFGGGMRLLGRSNSCRVPQSYTNRMSAHGPEPTCDDVRYSVAIRGNADVTRTSNYFWLCPKRTLGGKLALVWNRTSL